MLQATIDFSRHTVAINASGNKRDALKELRASYKELTGTRAAFRDLDEARKQLAAALASTLPKGYKADGDAPATEGPVARARRIFAVMQGKPRQEIIEECVKAGINRNTASTQLSLWVHGHH